MQTDNVGHQSDIIIAIRVVDQDGIWRPTDKDVRTTRMHGEIEMISEKLVYRKFIKDSETETGELFERKKSRILGLD